MHRFLRAVGFSNITTKQDMDKLLGITMDKPSVSKQILSKDGRKITELSREFAHNTGLTVRGEYDKLGFFHVDHYFPYCYSSLITMRTEVTINRRVDGRIVRALKSGKNRWKVKQVRGNEKMEKHKEKNCEKFKSKRYIFAQHLE